jgi:hypothetical protein
MARGISEALALRIGHSLLAASGPAPHHDGAATSLLPWVPSPELRLSQHVEDPDRQVAYLDEASSLIRSRIQHLAETVQRDRPAWMSLLGQRPTDRIRYEQWLRHIAIIVAYRDQHQVAVDDPRQILGPYVTRDRAGHAAYWHAAESVTSARHVAGLNPATASTHPDEVRAQVAADIYRSLPETERAAVSTEMSAHLGPIWFGQPGGMDDHAAIHRAYATWLNDALARRGYLTSIRSYPHRPTQVPLEAELIQRRGHPQPAKTRTQPGQSAPSPAPPAQQPGHLSANSVPEPIQPVCWRLNQPATARTRRSTSSAPSA